MSRNRASLNAAIVGMVAMLIACTGCISISSPDPNAVPGSPPSFVDRLKAAVPVQPSATAAKTLAPGISGFATAGRNIACVLTDSRNGQVNSPFEPNSFADPANQPQPVVPVVHCELTKYPAPQDQDVKDDCGGTGIGYLGGVVLLAPDAAVYGACRAGLTGMEGSGDDASSTKKLLAALPVLTDGSALDAKGYRCAAMDSGVACANLGNGAGFFVAQDKYVLFGGEQQ